MSSLSDNLAALREPEFRKLFFGQAASVVGTMLTVVAVPFAVLEIGGTATDIGIVEAAYFLPMVLMVAVGGVWADRLDRRRVMLVVDLMRTILQLATAALLLAGLAEVWMLVVMHAVAGVGDAFFRPAYTGLVPQVVSAARLQQANALQGLVQSGSVTLGAATGGLLVAAMGAGWAIGIDGCTFLVSAVFLWRLEPRPLGAAAVGEDLDRGDPERETVGGAGASSAGFLADLRLGWREFTSHTWLWVMVSGASVFLMTVEAPMTVLGPLVARDHYDGARTWGFLAAAMGLGQMAGGVVALRWRPRRPFLILACGMSLTALPMAALATVAPIWALMASASVLGVVWGLFDPFWLTAMQREVPPDMISRVSSYDYLGSLAFYPAGLAIAGPFADLVGVSTTLWVGAACGVAVSLFWLSWRDVRGVHDLGPRESPPSVSAMP